MSCPYQHGNPVKPVCDLIENVSHENPRGAWHTAMKAAGNVEQPRTHADPADAAEAVRQAVRDTSGLSQSEIEENPRVQELITGIENGDIKLTKRNVAALGTLKRSMDGGYDDKGRPVVAYERWHLKGAQANSDLEIGVDSVALSLVEDGRTSHDDRMVASNVITDRVLARNPEAGLTARHATEVYDSLSRRMKAYEAARAEGDLRHSISSEDRAVLADLVASRLHDQWREGWAASNGGKRSDGSYPPRMKDDGNGGQVDIANTAYPDLPPKWQAENQAAARGAVDSFSEIRTGLFGRSNEGTRVDSISHSVHEQWLERNGEWAPEDQKLNYFDLSEENKEKDRVVVREVMRAFQSTM